MFPVRILRSVLMLACIAIPNIPNQSFLGINLPKPRSKMEPSEVDRMQIREAPLLKHQ